MNRNFHRVIFNAVRGHHVVVQESATSVGKGVSRATATSNGSTELAQTSIRRASPAIPCAVAVLLACLTSLSPISPAHAQIAADPSAAPNQRATILAAPNGVPLVNITTPSAAGVSRNTFSQFDIQSNGAVLNNSRSNIQSQLGAWVQGNPWLAAGSARVILNEVNSTSPTYLNGYIEVAGQRAEVVVANPNGISVNGSGFINVSRATLTTGALQLNLLGGLQGFMVNGGTISIGSAGLDARTTDYAAILARAVTLNAGIWASDLKVVTGANQIPVDANQVAPITGNGATPTFALDVSALGGMYANSISLIGTEAGLGVRNTGAIGASAGNLVVTSAGRLENTGTLQGQSVELRSVGDLHNEGGTIVQASLNSLTLAASTLTNTSGGVVGPQPVATPTTGSGSSSSSPSSGSPTTGSAPAGSNTTADTIPGSISVAGTIYNDGGHIYAAGPITLQTPQVNNAGGALSVANMAVSGASFSNAGGTLDVSNTFNANVGQFNNTAGTLQAGRLAITTSGDLLNNNGTLASSGAANLNVAGTLNNAGGAIAAGADLAAQAGALNNSGTSSFIRSGNDSTLNITSILINDGSITSARHTTINAGSVASSRSGVLGAGIHADGILGTVGDLNVATTRAFAANGLNLVAGDATLQGASIDLSDSQTSAANITVTAIQGDVTTSTASVVTPGILAIAANNAAGQTLTNQEGQLNAAQLQLVASNLNNDGGHITTVGDLTATVSDAASNAGGLIAANGNVDIAANTLNNTNGLIAGNTLSVDTHGNTLTNTRGTLVAATTVDLQTGALANDAGLIQSGGATSINTHDQALTNTNAAGYSTGQGGITSVDALSLAIGDLNNAGGYIGAAKTLTASARNVANTAGVIATDANATLTSGGNLNNNGGLIAAGDTLQLVDPNAENPAAKTLTITNVGGTLIATNSVQIYAAIASLDGKLLSQGDLSVAQTQDINVAPGSQTVANNNLSLSTSGTVNNNGTLTAGNALALTAGDINNNATGIITASSITLSAANTLTNRGLIDGSETRVNAGTLNNAGTGRIYGDHIAIQAGVLNNDAEANNGVASAGTIAARNRLDMGVGTLNNSHGALIYSAGDMAIGGALDANGHAIGMAGTVNNTAATIQAASNLGIAAVNLNNLNGGVTYTLQPGVSQTVVEYAPVGSTQRYASDQVRFNGGPQGFTTAESPTKTGDYGTSVLILPSAAYPWATFTPYYINPPANSVDTTCQSCSGGDAASCTDVTIPGAWYSRANPIWATFGVTPPAEDLPANNVMRLHPDAVVGQDGFDVTTSGYSGDFTTHVLFAHPITQTEYDTYHAWLQSHVALDAAVAAFKQSIPPRTLRTWDYWQYTDTPSVPVLQTSSPGQILSGGAMTLLVGQGSNDMSQIIAGGNLSITGGQVTNVAMQVTAPETQTGIAGYSWVKSHLFSTDERIYDISGYNTAINTIVMLAAAKQQGNTAVAAGNAPGATTPGHTNQSATGAGGRVSPIIEVPAAVNNSGNGSPSVAEQVIRTTIPNLGLPNASLYRLAPNAYSPYLIETDPRFANYRNWLGSDYLLNQLGLDPNITLKRLGDGFYEQQLIDQQVSQLTGGRYLDGYGNGQDEYAALMNAGATFGKQYGLSVGVGLSPTQMAQLTSDIVWLVAQDVTLPDGDTQTVLVPQVYVRTRPGDIDGSGALLAGASVDMRLAGDLNNSGTVAGRHVVAISADNINNIAGRISGNSVALSAATDINNVGGTMDANTSLSLSSGRDINVIGTTRTSTNADGTRSNTVFDRVAGLYVTGSGNTSGGTLTTSSGRDTNLYAAQLVSAGSIDIGAKGNINLGTVQTGTSETLAYQGTGNSNTRSQTSSREVGTAIHSAGNASLTAGNDLNARAATVQATGDVALSAGRNIGIEAGVDTQSLSEHHDNGSKGVFSTRSISDDSLQQSTLARSTISGQNVAIASGKAGRGDITLAAAHIDAGNSRGTLSLDAADGKGSISLPVQQTLQIQSHDEKNDSTFWTGQSGAGIQSQTSHYNQIGAGAIQANAASIAAQVGVTQTTGTHNGEQSVTTQGNAQQTLAQLSIQPGMQWINQFTNAPGLEDKINWDQVNQNLQKWDYASSHLSGAGAALVVIVVTMATMGTGTAAAAGTAAGNAAAISAGEGVALSGGGAFFTGTGSVIASVAGGAVQAGVTAIAAQATVSLVNNGGDIGATLTELGSSGSLKNLAAAMAIGGVAGYFGDAYGIERLAAQATAGCASGAAGGTGCEKGAEIAAFTTSAAWGYNAMVGYDASPGPGKNTDKAFYDFDKITGQQLLDSQGNNVIGQNEAGYLCSQGTTCSKVLNYVPFVNAAAGWHDWIFNANPDGLDVNELSQNVGLMIPAAAIGIGASLNYPSILGVLYQKYDDKEEK